MSNIKEFNKPEIVKIAVSGLSCSVIDNSAEVLLKTFTEKGYKVIVTPDISEELKKSGIAKDADNIFSYHKNRLKSQLFFEDSAYEYAAGSKEDKVLVISLQGSLYDKAFLNSDEFDRLLRELDLNETMLRDRYDAVFHLQALLSDEYSFLSNDDGSRIVSADAARNIDFRLISAWVGTPHFRVISGISKDDQTKNLLKEICSFLGDPEPLEIERKFLIKYPDLEALNANPFCRKVEISQTYLIDENGENIRLRRRGSDGNYIYIKTQKIHLSDIKRIEIEERLTKKEYLDLLNAPASSKRTISKDRYCIMYDRQYFELDIYPFWNDKAVVELELDNEDQEIRFPEELEIIEEVSYDRSYTNFALADKYNEFSADKDERKLAVIFPGIGYHKDKPLLYYSAKLAKESGYELMFIEYGKLPSGVKGSEDKMRAAYAQAMVNVREQFKSINKNSFNKVLFISKSIGTAIAATIDNELKLDAYHVYYTPVEASFEAIGHKGIVFHGTADDWARTEVIENECKKRNLPLYITKAANHSMETGDAIADLHIIKEIMRKTLYYINSI